MNCPLCHQEIREEDVVTYEDNVCATGKCVTGTPAQAWPLDGDDDEGGEEVSPVVPVAPVEA